MRLYQLWFTSLCALSLADSLGTTGACVPEDRGADEGSTMLQKGASRMRTLGAPEEDKEHVTLNKNEGAVAAAAAAADKAEFASCSKFKKEHLIKIKEKTRGQITQLQTQFLECDGKKQ